MTFLDWYDADELGYLLNISHPSLDPLSLSFTELHTMILKLKGFSGDPAGSCESLLEAIQMAWLESSREK